MKKMKFRFFIDHEDEEQWINKMAEMGWHLKKFWPFVFVFEKGNPGEYIYRNEMVLGRKQDYFEFLEMVDVERVHRFGIWSYFRKKRTDGPFDIYSDSTNKIRYLSKINHLFIPVCILNILVVIMNVIFPLLHGELSKSVMIGSVLNVLAVVLLYMAIRKNRKRKKALLKTRSIFES